MQAPGTWWRGGTAVAAAVLALTGCTGDECHVDRCPEVDASRAGVVVARDTAGVERWRTTVADLVTSDPFIEHGHVVVHGCHAPHVLDLATGSAMAVPDLRRVVAVMDGERPYAVGLRERDGAPAAEPLDGGPGGLVMGGTNVDGSADESVRVLGDTLAATSTSVVAVDGQTLYRHTLQAGRWVTTTVELPVGPWRRDRVLVVDDAHVVVPGADGSVLGVDVEAGVVRWRSLPTRPDPARDLWLTRIGPDVVVTVTYAGPPGSPSPPPATGPVDHAGDPGERWTVDGSTGDQLGPREVVSGLSRSESADITRQVTDVVTGWTVTHTLQRPPMGMCG